MTSFPVWQGEGVPFFTEIGGGGSVGHNAANADQPRVGDADRP